MNLVDDDTSSGGDEEEEVIASLNRTFENRGRGTAVSVPRAQTERPKQRERTTFKFNSDTTLHIKWSKRPS